MNIIHNVIGWYLRRCGGESRSKNNVVVLIALAVACFIMLTPGCATPSGTVSDIAKAASSVKFAASLGTRIALRESPGIKAYFHAAVTALDTLIAFDTVTPDRLRETLLALPIKEVRSADAVAFVQDALDLYKTYADDAVQRGLDQSAYTRPLLTAFREGIFRALNQPR